MSETPLPPGLSPVKGYNLYRKISRFPELLPRMRSAFLEVLLERGVITRESLASMVAAQIATDGVPDTEATRAEYRDALIDLFFANSLAPDEAENHINLVRKRDKCQELGRVVASDLSTSEAIWRALREFCDIPKGELYISPEEAEGIRVSLLSYYISGQLPFIGIAKNHVTIRDVDTILRNTIGHVRYPGKLGGKAAGMIVAQKILLPILLERDPEFEKRISVPDTWYITSGVFSDFIDRNHFYDFHTHKYRDRDAIDEEYQRVGGLFEKASFPADVVEEFRKLIRTIGEHPIIVRSSSYLEDSFGLAFSGKYQSIFLANRGDEDTRLAAFITGVKTVLASMYGPDPIIYRRDHGLLDFNERMAMIVQKVVGRRFGNWFFPFAAGVMYSYNSWAWNPRIRKRDGLVRLVFGLGTRAVDRVGGDYPRMIPLSHPQMRPEITAEQILRYSQKMVDAINLSTGAFETVDFRTLAAETHHPDLFDAVSVTADGEMRAPLSRLQDLAPSSLCLTFENFIAKSPFVPLVKKVLATVQAAFGRQVDMEFAWDGDKLYILQCRSLSIRRETTRVTIPTDTPKEDVIFITRSGVSNAMVPNLEYIVYVDPRAYDRLETVEKKQRIGRAVGLLNQRLAGKRYGLLGPGRWGSNDINLGVRVSYSDINNTRLLVEIAFAREGYTPEVSYGTHFFQDLVEADIAILPLYPDAEGNALQEQFLTGSPNSLASVERSLADVQDVIHLIHVPSVRDGRMLQVYLDEEKQEGAAILAAAIEPS
ncbi:MAG TPA: PEP/pyruvate-binding domain-containing protein [Spirochaetia bacterium]|nr:PEP/pyruvate-binding domain-containing protein [Spirochaetia bacterium]